jgi:hypothetical protein
MRKRSPAGLIFILILTAFVLITGLMSCASTKATLYNKDYRTRHDMADKHELTKNKYMYKSYNCSYVMKCSSFNDTNNNWMFIHGRQRKPVKP